MDTAEYQEFMKFLEFKRLSAAEPPPAAAPAPPPAAAPPPDFAPSPFPAAVPAFGGRGGGAPFKIDWNRHIGNVLQRKPWRSEGWSVNPNLFELFNEFYKDFPERFRVIGELHSGDDGRNYFSFAYEKPGVPYGRVTFHVYGQLSGNKFTYESVDIKIGKTEEYLNAARFNTAPRA